MSIPLETRYECPVCLGVTLQKTFIGSDKFILDHCTRCGGIWFDAGEVNQLRAAAPDDLWKTITRREGVHSMHCHSCDVLLERDAEKCEACGWSVTLDCPRCRQEMDTAAHGGVTLDACRSCKGIWVDHHELTQLWKAEFVVALERHHVGREHGGSVVLEALAWDPFTTYYVANAAGHILSAGVQAGPAVAEAAAEAAGSLFETIADIIGGIFG
jgi:Zn-finger nucleic acid-binding protein